MEVVEVVQDLAGHNAEGRAPLNPRLYPFQAWAARAQPELAAQHLTTPIPATQCRLPLLEWEWTQNVLVHRVVLLPEWRQYNLADPIVPASL